MGKVIGRKGQAAAFVIIAIVVVLSAFIISYLSSRSETTIAETETEKLDSELAGQSELEQYVGACIRPAVLQGLEIMRLQGGYVNILPGTSTMVVKDKNNKQVKIVDGSKKVVVDSNGLGNKVPYWLTKDSLAVPTLSFMEKEIEEYVAREVMKCVNDFEPFRRQNYDVSYGRLGTNVEMDKSVVVDVNFPITLKRGATELYEAEFKYIVPVNMRLIGDMASDLTLFETAYTYLEEHTKNLISLYSAIDENSLPPFAQSMGNTDCSRVRWEKEDVKERLKAVFDMNVPHLKIEGTDFTLPKATDPVSRGVYESFVYDIFDENFPNVNVDFSYRPEWAFIEYDILPSLGGSLLPHTVRQNKIPMIGLICALDYSFKYSIDYPVLVEINEKESARIDSQSNVYFENKGFKFQFLVDAYVCGNQNRECTGKAEFVFNSSAADELNVTLLPDSYLCDEEQRVSGEIVVNTYDSLTMSKLPEVDVFYWCGSYQNDCFIGRTDETGRLKAKFPYCMNGMIYFTKKDYAEHKEILTVMDKNDRAFDYKISPLKEFKVEAKKLHVPTYIKNYHETGSLAVGSSERAMEASEKAMISAIGPNSISYMHPDPENTTVKVTGGSYEFMVSLFGDVDIMETDYGDGAVAKGFKGSYILGQTSLNWNVVPDDLRKSKVTFFALAEYSSSELNPGTWREIDDAILNDNGMSAELLYQCQKVITSTGGTVPATFYCNWSNCNFADIDGTNQIEFHDDSNNCRKAYRVDIPKEKYQPYVMPRFS